MPGISDVAGRQHALPAGFLDEPFGLAGVVVFIEIGDQKVCPLAGEGEGDSAANARIAAGQEHLLVAQTTAAPVAVLAVVWSWIHQGSLAGNRLLLSRKRGLREMGHAAPG